MTIDILLITHKQTNIIKTGANPASAAATQQHALHCDVTLTPVEASQKTWKLHLKIMLNN